MKVTGFDGKSYNWPPKGCIPKHNSTRPRSELHLRARALLQQLFPTVPRLEEVPLPGSDLRFDFVVPIYSLVVEVQGQQHEKFVNHFHNTMGKFFQGRANDQAKRDWCEAHDLELVELLHDESDEEWGTKILGG